MKRLFGLLILLFTLSLTSCLTIEEIYTFKSDGSGTMKYIIDMSEMASLMKSFQTEEDSPTEMDSSMAEAAQEFEDKAAKLKAIKGISGVNNSADNENFVYTISFDFKDINSLNTALNEIMKDSADTQFHEYFKMKGKNLERSSLLGNKMKEAMGLGGEEESDEGAEMANMMLEQMKYNLSFTFEDGVKVKTNSTVGNLSDDKKVYTMKSNFKQLTETAGLLDANFKMK